MQREQSDSAGNANKKKAQEKIDIKLKLLDAWSEYGIPWLTDAEGRRLCDSDNRPILEYFPSTKEEFAMWTSSQHTAPQLLEYPELREFQSFSRDTLNQPHNKLRKDLVEAALDRICARAGLQVEGVCFADELKKITAERNHWKKLAHAQESEIAIYRELAIDAIESLDEERALRIRVTVHAQRKMARLQTELNKIRAKQTQGKVISLFGDSKDEGSRNEE